MTIDDPDLSRRVTDPRLLRLRVELFTAMQTLQGQDLEDFHDLMHEVVSSMDAILPRTASASRSETDRLSFDDGRT